MYQIYQIMPGDNLDSIASMFGTNADNLISINGLVRPFNLVPGNYLVVPKMENELFYKYIVQKGDSLYALAGRFRTDVKTLETLNGLEANEYIYPGQEILIPREGYLVYITEEETLRDIANKSGVDVSDWIVQNQNLVVLPDQIVAYKK